MKRLTNKDFLALLKKIEYNAGFLEVDSPCGCTEGEIDGIDYLDDSITEAIKLVKQDIEEDEKAVALQGELNLGPE